MSDTTKFDADWQAADAVEEELSGLERYVSTMFRGDLPAVEAWCARFTKLFNNNPAIREYRKSAFAHLLRVHNAAIEGHGKGSRLGAAR